MNKTIWLAMLACVATFNAHAEVKPIQTQNLSFNSRYPLYLSDQSKFTYDEVDKALDTVYSDQRPVLFFIHGRGNEPKKSLDKGTFVDGGAVRNLEAQFNVRVLMFNWESKALFYNRSVPLSKMKASADSLSIVLEKMSKYFSVRTNLKRPVLLAHSMGSIVLENYVTHYGWLKNFDSNLFSNILITSPDADNVNHWDWLDEIGIKESVYLTINKNDDVLEKSTDSRYGDALALGLDPLMPLSGNINYLDVTKLVGGVHEIFNKEKMKTQVFICEIITRLFNGNNPILDSKNTIKTGLKNYFKIKPQTSESDPCFVY